MSKVSSSKYKFSQSATEKITLDKLFFNASSLPSLTELGLRSMPTTNSAFDYAAIIDSLPNPQATSNTTFPLLFSDISSLK